MADQIDSIIKIRRGEDSQRRGIIFGEGEIVYSTDIKRVFIGDNTTIGGNLVGNKNTLGSSLDNYGIKNDIYFNTNTSVLYMLSSDSGPDNLNNYARITPIADNSTILYQNGTFSINTNLFNSYVKLSGDVMTGYLILNGHPTISMHAATKGYVDTNIQTLSTSFSENSFDTRYVKLTGNETITGSITIQAPLNVYLDTQLDSTLIVGGSSFFNGLVNFNNNLISKYKTSVKNINLRNDIIPVEDTYTLILDDTGSIIVTSCIGVGYISVPYDLPIGFTVTIVNISDNPLVITPAETIDGMELLNIYGSFTISNKNGICNLITISDKKTIVTGDLS